MEGVIENAKEKIITKLSDLQDHGLFNNRNISGYVDKIYLAQSLSEAIQDSVYIQESGPEDLFIKKEELVDVLSVTWPVLGSPSSLASSLLWLMSRIILFILLLYGS